MLRSDDPENKAQILRIRARNHFMRGNYSEALADTINGLHMLGVDVNPSPTTREADRPSPTFPMAGAGASPTMT